MNVKVVVTKELRRVISKHFKKESRKVFDLFDSLKVQPQKGKLICIVGTLVLKELKYKSHRFYFIIKNNQLILLKQDELKELLIIFMAMSKKNDQQETIHQIKEALKKFE